MGNRLSKIYTRTGDKGTTGLGDGSRVAKNSLRISAIGDVDELNAVIGLMLTETFSDEIQSLLTEVQHNLFNLGGELCMPNMTLVHGDCVTRLETQLDQLNESLSPLEEFILPGGSKAAAYCHLARTVCRRAERTMYTLNESEQLTETALQYINRLSDFLFVLCRIFNKEANIPDVLWNNTAKK